MLVIWEKSSASATKSLGDLHAAKYWYGRAVEENPEVRLVSTESRKRLQRVGIDDII